MTPLWTQFFDTPVSGNAKVLAMRLAQEPFRAESIESRNVREFAASLRMLPFEYEDAYRELRHPHVAWIHGDQYDRPMLKAGALPRLLLADIPSVEAIQAKQQQQQQQKPAQPEIERISRSMSQAKDHKR